MNEIIFNYLASGIVGALLIFSLTTRGYPKFINRELRKVDLSIALLFFLLGPFGAAIAFGITIAQTIQLLWLEQN